jgi:hypothetical protein
MPDAETTTRVRAPKKRAGGMLMAGEAHPGLREEERIKRNKKKKLSMTMHMGSKTKPLGDVTCADGMWYYPPVDPLRPVGNGGVVVHSTATATTIGAGVVGPGDADFPMADMDATDKTVLVPMFTMPNTDGDDVEMTMRLESFVCVVGVKMWVSLQVAGYYPRGLASFRVHTNIPVCSTDDYRFRDTCVASIPIVWTQNLGPFNYLNYEAGMRPYLKCKEGRVPPIFNVRLTDDMDRLLPTGLLLEWDAMFSFNFETVKSALAPSVQEAMEDYYDVESEDGMDEVENRVIERGLQETQETEQQTQQQQEPPQNTA